jgi:hypothetical protein
LVPNSPICPLFILIKTKVKRQIKTLLFYHLSFLHALLKFKDEFFFYINKAKLKVFYLNSQRNKNFSGSFQPFVLIRKNL